jgi:hypothetical protein
VWNTNVGIGQAPGADSLDITNNQNAGTLAYLQNNSAGTSAQADWRATNGTNTAYIGMYGVNYSNAVLKAKAFVASDTNLMLQTFNTNPLELWVGGSEMGEFNSSGFEIPGGGATPLYFGSTAAAANGVISNLGGAMYYDQGCYFNGTNWIATQANANIIVENGSGTVSVYSATGLTPGNSFSPTWTNGLSYQGTTVGNVGAWPGAGGLNVASGVYLNMSAYTNPDYVFDRYYHSEMSGQKDPTYKGLLPLKDVETYITAHHELPRITDTKNNGEVFHRTDRLLEKVEELTLYTIQQQKQIDKLQKEVDQLKKK